MEGTTRDKDVSRDTSETSLLFSFFDRNLWPSPVSGCGSQVVRAYDHQFSTTLRKDFLRSFLSKVPLGDLIYETFPKYFYNNLTKPKRLDIKRLQGFITLLTITKGESRE